MNDQTGDELYELYARFKQELNEGNLNEFYDAEELIAIFDKASDLEDDYVRMEVLLRGQQYHPGNEELRVRRGFLYLDLEIEEGALSVTASPAGRNPLRTILKLRTQINSISPEKAKQKLDRLIDHSERLDDEATIQLVDCAHFFGLADWLRKAMPRLRTKVLNLPTLLLESSAIFFQAADYGSAIKALEELTDLDPFDIDNWNDLAKNYNAVNQPERALLAIEYALALDPANIPALTIKANSLMTLGRDIELEELLSPWAGRLITVDENTYIGLVTALYNLGRKERAFDLLRDRAEAHHDEFEPLDLLLTWQAPNLRKLLALNYAAGGRLDPTQWLIKARDFYNQGNYYAAREMYAVMDADGKLPASAQGFYASALYVTGQYSDCARILEDLVILTPNALTLDICVAGLLSMCRLGHLEEARLMLDRLDSMFPFALETQWRISTNLARLGIRTFFNTLDEMLRDPDHFDIKRIDFFSAPVRYNPDSL